MKKKFLLILAVAALLITPVMASASESVCNPNFPPDSVFNKFDDWNNVGAGLIVADLTETSPTENPIGKANFFGAAVTGGIKVDGDFYFDTSNNPVVQLKVFNFPYRPTEKNVYVYAKYGDNNRFIDSVKVDLFKDGQNTPYSTQNFDIAGGEGAYSQTFEFALVTNPDFEVFTFYLGGECTWIVDKFCIATQCVPEAPIPGSLLLMGSGIIGLVGIGIRRKSA